MNLALAINGAFPAGVTYTGASLKMDVDKTGALAYGPNNLLTQSNTFSNVAWTKDPAITLTSGIADPLGGTAAWTVTSGVGADNQMYRTVGASGSSAINSIWMRRRTGTGAINFRAPDSSVTDVSSLLSGSWTQVYLKAANGGTNNFLIGIHTSGDAIDIYQAVQGTITYETTPRPQDNVITTASAYYGPRFGYDNNGNPLGYFSEEGRTNLLPKSISPNDALWGGTIAASKASSGIIDPLGTTGASLVTADGTNAIHTIRFPSFTFGAGVNYALSCFAKPLTAVRLQFTTSASGGASSFFNYNFVSKTITTVGGANVLSTAVVEYPNGWFRFILVFTGVAATDFAGKFINITADNSIRAETNTNTDSFYMDGVQMEVVSSNYPGPTSLIATDAASVARAADVASITGSNFSGWHNQLAGTYVVQATPPATSVLGAIISDNDAGTTRLTQILRGNATFAAAGLRWLGQTGGGALIVTGADDASATTKAAFAYQAGDQAFTLSGAVIGSTSVALAGSTNQLEIGQRASGLWFNGHIASIKYYPARLSNGTLQSLTT